MRFCRVFPNSAAVTLQGRCRLLQSRVQVARYGTRDSLAGTRGLDLPLPLSERPATQSGSVQQLLNWKLEQSQRIDAAGDGLEDLDNGPSASQLKVLPAGFAASPSAASSKCELSLLIVWECRLSLNGCWRTT